MHLHFLWASDILMLLSMLAILLTDLHNTYNFILLLFSPNSLLLCIIPFILQACLTDLASPPMTFILLNLLLPLLPWFFCCLPSSPAGKKPRLFLTEILASFLFKLAHSLLITIDYFWLWFILICEMYAPELNGVLHKSIYQPQKDYLSFFSKRFSLFWAMVQFDVAKECRFGTGCLNFHIVKNFNEKFLKTLFFLSITLGIKFCILYCSIFLLLYLFCSFETKLELGMA